MERETFDVTIMKELTEPLRTALAEHPEIRSIAVVVDFVGDLNHSNKLQFAAWLDEQGYVRTPAACFGMSHQLSRLQSVAMDRVVMLTQEMQKQYTAQAKQLIKGTTNEDNASGNPNDPSTSQQ